MTSLREITEDMLSLQQLSEDDCPDMDQAIQDTMEGIVGSFQDKAEKVATVILNIGSNIAEVDNEIKRLQARKKTMQNKDSAIKAYLRENMEATGITKIECPLFSIALKNGRSMARIDNESELPDDYVKVKTEITPDKTAILKALKEGVEIPGASIDVSKSSVIIK
ncbi:MAG: siphovirus Gp157 family protein [Pseudomonadales bacterium]|nr:siphovirus Gp157 family protein [Pseudomonadales bacterium]